MTRLVLGSSLLVSLSLVGCGSVEQTGPGPTDPGDTTAPSIMQVTPAPDEAGVPADAAIVVVFSEPMDRASVEAAYNSQHLPAGAVTMSWNEAGDTLTITPKQPLALAEGIGNDPSTTEATKYELWVDEDATDLAGNELTGQLQLGFTTQKRMSTTVAYDPELTRYRSSTGGLSAVGVDLRIGDNASLSYRGFVTFDLSTLPDGIEIEAAALRVRQAGFIGTPFDLGVVNATHIVYTTVSSTAWNAPSLGSMGALTTSDVAGPRSLGVAAAVAEDYNDRVARANRTQYRLEFPTANNGDGDGDNLDLAVATFEMPVTYLAP